MQSSEGFKASIFQKLIELAKKAEAGQDVPIGAAVVKNGRIVGEGFNVRESQNNPVGHAEIMALQSAAKNLGSWNLEGCEVWTTLEPCPMCMSALMMSRIKKVYYGAKDPKGGAVSLELKLNEHPKLNHRFEAEWVENEECSSILKEFFKKIRSEKRESES